MVQQRLRSQRAQTHREGIDFAIGTDIKLLPVPPIRLKRENQAQQECVYRWPWGVREWVALRICTDSCKKPIASPIPPNLGTGPLDQARRPAAQTQEGFIPRMSSLHAHDLPLAAAPPFSWSLAALGVETTLRPTGTAVRAGPLPLPPAAAAFDAT